MATQAQQASLSLAGTSKAFQDAVNSSSNALGRFSGALWSGRNMSRVWDELRSQSEELERQVALLQEQNMAYDKVGARVLMLRQQFSYLSDDRLRALAQEQLKAEENGFAYNGQSRAIADGNRALEERTRLLERQADAAVTTREAVSVAPSGVPTQIIEVRLTAAVGRVDFDLNTISAADKEKLVKLFLDTIGRHRV
jgi:hypothetical protein